MTDIVYILTNDAMEGFLKIRLTTTSVEQRMRELDTTGVPLPFTCFHASEVSDGRKTEKLLHDAFKDNRVRQRREFFQIDPERVRSALLLAELNDVTPRDDIETEDGDIEALTKVRKRRGKFIMSNYNIPVGAILTLSKDENITCKVLENNNVEFEDEVMTLSGSCLQAMHNLGFTWKAVAGPDYWQYEGETLVAIRTRHENEFQTLEAIWKNHYRVESDEDGSISVWNIQTTPATPIEPAKPILRNIANDIEVSIKNTNGNMKNTRQLGAHVIQKLKLMEL